MCLIIVGLGSDTPDRRALDDACFYNPDGFGWAIVAKHDDGTNRLVTNKSMLDTEAVDQYLGAMSLLGERVLYSVFHARIATHGTTSIDNCHPFPIAGDRDTVLFHNGMLSRCHAEGDPRSDTVIFASDWLPAIGGHKALANDYVRQMVSDFALGSKLVIASVELDVPIIINEGAGEWRKGLWFSNRATTFTNIGSNWRSENWQNGFLACKWCESKLPASDVCDVCALCQECGAELCTTYADGRAAKPPYCADCDWCSFCEQWVGLCKCEDTTVGDYDVFDPTEDDSIRLDATLRKYAMIEDRFA